MPGFEVFGDKEFLTDDDIKFLEQRLEEIYAAGEDALFGEGVLAAAFSGEIVVGAEVSGSLSWSSRGSRHPTSWRRSPCPGRTAETVASGAPARREIFR